MKERPVLYIAIIISLLAEFVLMALVYQKVGVERLPVQVGRLLLQIILILFVVFQKSSKALFVLTAYHFLSGAFGIIGCADCNWLKYWIASFHILFAFIIYFHDFFEDKLLKRNDT